MNLLAAKGLLRNNMFRIDEVILLFFKAQKPRIVDTI